MFMPKKSITRGKAIFNMISSGVLGALTLLLGIMGLGYMKNSDIALMTVFSFIISGVCLIIFASNYYALHIINEFEKLPTQRVCPYCGKVIELKNTVYICPHCDKVL